MLSLDDGIYRNITKNLRLLSGSPLLKKKVNFQHKNQI